MVPLDAFLPSFDDISESVRLRALPEIKDGQLVAAILQNAGLQEDIRRLIFQRAFVDTTAKITDGSLIAKAQVICGRPMNELLTDLGAAAHALSLARMAATDLNALEGAGILRAQVKAALAYRHVSLADDPKSVINASRLQRTAAACLACWLATIPDDLANVLRLRLPSNEMPARSSQRRRYTRICTNYLDRQAELAGAA